ncbi:universal stress protein [Sphingomonas abietis]|uniref:Universal stress protein n=1 Tax=Sphingomonas abietis TaxID=3012344 RepID=A0ABY7NH65_9SPHN|nr:universal stress protein [Sphingomonas abietis]WBO20673.1 universal stress protein [Sphingomonas abietis]
MKTILLLVHDDPGQEARLQVALDLTRGLNGHLNCLDVSILPNVAGDFYGATAMILEDERERESANRSRLEPRLAREDVPWNWRDITGELSECLAREATLADLIVVNRGLDTILSPDMRHVADHLLHDTKTPVFAVPDTATSLDVKGHGLVAWDGSDAAGAALRAATPLLVLAEKITIVQVGKPCGDASAEDAAAYLSRHGGRATVDLIRERNDDVGARLLAEVRNRRADYIVMGGYGHNRLREALLGGVTRTLLRETRVPLFLAH